MSEDIAISVRNAGKAYTLVHNQARHTTLAEAALERIRHPFRRQNKETFWALRDISFDIRQGDVVGIIGRNGAGKSTLLKVLSQITQPTTGEIDLWGRVGSLLEVGTGFHPELTGRENIYLNGHILGMRKKEIDRQFDAIVDFAGVEQFLDTPVKRFSSGMYVRLAFAVAAHLDSEILIVDEVLAVGDTDFQKKCLGKMKDVARSGRTVILVSHNMAAVGNLCNSALVIRNGQLMFQGDTNQAIAFYAQQNASIARTHRDPSEFRPKWARNLIRSATVRNAAGHEQGTFLMGSDIRIDMTFQEDAVGPLGAPVMGIVLNHSTMGIVGGVNTRMTAFEPQRGVYHNGTMSCTLKRPPFLPGTYSVDLWLGDGHADVDCLLGFVTFDLETADVYGTGRPPAQKLGVIFLDAEWNLDANPDEVSTRENAAVVATS